MFESKVIILREKVKGNDVKKILPDYSEIQPKTSRGKNLLEDTQS